MLERNHPNVLEFKASAPLIFAPHHGESLNDCQRHQTHISRSRRTSRSKTIAIPRGLWNAGQTCHLGATVSALSAAHSLQTWLRKQRVEENSPFATTRGYLLQASTSYERHGLDPRPLLRILEMTSGWKSRHAQDAHETLARMLEILDLSNCRHFDEDEYMKGLTVMNLESKWTPHTKFIAFDKRSSTLMPFTMVTSSSRRCCNCNHASETFVQRGSTVILPVPSTATSLASLFITSQVSRERVEMRCDNCSMYGMHLRATDIERLPKLLIVHLQKAVFISGCTKSAEGRATIPLLMDLPEGRSVRGKLRKRRYSLCSVVRHWGGSGGQYGHFDCVVRQDCRQGLAAIANRASWWHVDDDKVWPSTAANACRPSNAYLVLYEMQSNDEV